MMDEKKKDRYKMMARVSLSIIALIILQDIVSYAIDIDPSLTDEAKTYFVDRCKSIGYSNEQINGFLNSYSADQINWINNDYGAKATRELTHEYMMETLQKMGENAVQNVAGNFLDTVGSTKAGLLVNKLFQGFPSNFIPPLPRLPIPIPNLVPIPIP